MDTVLDALGALADDVAGSLPSGADLIVDARSLVMVVVVVVVVVAVAIDVTLAAEFSF